MSTIMRGRLVVRWALDRRCACSFGVGAWRRNSPSNIILSVQWIGTLPDEKEQNNKNSTQTSTNTREVAKNWLKQLRSPPNMITSARILSTPVLSYLIITQQHEYALVGCVVAGCSDWLDGYLAKNYDMSTVLGTYLDPFADKVMINVLALSMCYSGILPTPLIVLWLGRDVLLVGGSYWHVRTATLKGERQRGRWIIDPVNTPLKVEPTNISKANTVLQFLTLSLGMLQPIAGLAPWVLDSACIVTGGTTIASGLSYVGNSAFSKSGNKKNNAKDSI